MSIDNYEHYENIYVTIGMLLKEIECIEDKDILNDIKNIEEYAESKLQELEPIIDEQNEAEKKYFNEMYERSVL